MEFKSSEGMWLTQVADVPIDSRICTKSLFCSERTFFKKWHEITDARKKEYDAEYEAWLREQENAPEGAV